MHTKKHIHHWKVGPPNASGISVGVCQCGSVRSFADWEDRRGKFGALLNAPEGNGDSRVSTKTTSNQTALPDARTESALPRTADKTKE